LIAISFSLIANLHQHPVRPRRQLAAASSIFAPLLLSITLALPRLAPAQAGVIAHEEG